MKLSAALSRSVRSLGRTVVALFTGFFLLSSFALPGCAKKAQERKSSASTSAGAPAAGGAAGPASSAAPTRLLIRTGRLSFVVSDVDRSRRQVEAIAKSAGGYLHRAELSQGEHRSWVGVVKVPPRALPQVLVKLRGLGKVTAETLDTKEVTAAVMDVRARLKNLRTSETRLQQIAAQKTADVKDLLLVEAQLTRVRGQIEKLEATERHYVRAVGLATLTVELSAKAKPAAAVAAGTRVSRAFRAGLQHLWDFLVVLAVALGHLWPLLLLVLFVSVAVYRLRGLIRRGFVKLFGVKPRGPRPVYAGVAPGPSGYVGYPGYGSYAPGVPPCATSPAAPTPDPASDPADDADDPR